MLKILCIGKCSDCVQEVVRHLDKQFEIEIETGEEQTTDIVINLYYSETLGEDEIDGEKWLESVKFEENEIINSRENDTDFNLEMSEQVDSMLLATFPKSTQEERNKVAKKILEAIEKFIEEEEIHIE